MMTADQIRQMFLDYFQAKEHLVMPSSSLIPAGDPTLLLTTAGMVQMKPYFLGQVSPPARRMTSAQKCFRTTDIDTVGDHKHNTFFEMLGNFSVGDYFKREAIEYAWEFLIEHMKLDPKRLWVTIYTDDDEAFELWRETAGVPAERIYRYGKADNWWGPPGLEGPCGPCSEIHYDFGRDRGCADIASPEAIAEWNGEGDQPGCHPNCDRCERFVELWNLVFMQFFQDQEKTLTPLPAPNIDTGMGLERAAVILQGASNIYETDLFRPIIDKVCELTGREYGKDAETDRAVRVVAEHARGAAFLIGDGVVPGNDGRGYVLRRLIRRAVRFGRKLGLTESFLAQVAETAIGGMEEAYPDLAQNREFVLRVLTVEEEQFGETYERGESILQGMITFRKQYEDRFAKILQSIKDGDVNSSNFTKLFNQLGFYDVSLLEVSEGEKIGELDALEEVLDIAGAFLEAMEEGNQELATVRMNELQRWPDTLSGWEQFRLYDTYGFPPELTEELTRDHGLSVDVEDFQQTMDAQRERSRARGAKFTGGPQAKIFQYGALGIGATRFVGYEQLTQESVVVGLLAGDEGVFRAEAGQEVEVVLRETPFYAEGGGQVGDAGVIEGPQGRIQVSDTHSPIPDLIVHRGRVVEGVIALGDAVTAQVDKERRLDAARNHTGTHLVHAALRKVLGPHVRQAGSLVAPDRLRFDFTHIQALTPQELREVERLVNQEIRGDTPVQVRESAYTEALKEGALAFFGDKYGERVRVVEMGCDGGEAAPAEVCFSKEVCGGTHLGRTGQVGLFLITSEGSIGSGLRRIEALTGRGAEQATRGSLESLESLGRTLETSPGDLQSRVQGLLDELEQEQKRVAALERELALREAEGLLAKVVEVDGLRVLSARVTAASADTLREVGDYLKNKMGSGVVVLGAVLNDRPTLIAMITPDLVQKGLDARAVVKEAAQVIEGGGGGRPEMAQAGGRRAEKLEEALALVPSLLRK